MSTPKAITDAIAALKAERQPLASRLDAIDLALENLARAYGVSGDEQQLPYEPQRVLKRRFGTGRRRWRNGLLAIIEKAEHGLTISELRKATPKLGGVDRSAELQALKSAGKIKRVKNKWQAT